MAPWRGLGEVLGALGVVLGLLEALRVDFDRFLAPFWETLGAHFGTFSLLFQVRFLKSF